MRVLFILKKRNNSYGVSYGLMNSANFVADSITRRLNEVEAKVVSVSDANGIDREVHNFKPLFVIIEALWVTAEKMRELVELHPGVTWTVRLHSKTPFLSNEGIAFDWIGKYRELSRERPKFVLSANHQSMCDDIYRTIGHYCHLLPNIYDNELCGPRKRKLKDSVTINIGCFGAVRPMKNHLQQAVAAIVFANKMDKKLLFHINGDRSEQRGDQVVKNLRALFALSGGHELVEHSWMSHNDFMELITSMDLGMQVSFSETFNIVAADFVANDIPIVVSPEIDWMPKYYQANPTDVTSMVAALDVAWGNKNRMQILPKLALCQYNEDSLSSWAVFLKTFKL